MSRAGRGRLASVALVLPLALFLVVFLAWPLLTVMRSAVSDPLAWRVLPASAKQLSGWDRQSPPTPDMRAALARDLVAIEDAQVMGDLTRRLNAAQSGFRTLLTRTTSALRERGAGTDLAEIDPRWNEVRFWQAIADATASPYTDRYLLGAVDLERDAAGTIAALPAGQSANRAIMIRTFVVSAAVTLACLAIGLPYALLIAATGGWVRALLLGAVLLPLWTSLLVRTAAWFILLQENGLINKSLMALGLASGPLALIFNRAGVIIAMTHVLLPFMVLPIFSVLIGIPKNLMPAAASLGASPLRAFRRVLLPLALPGIVSGALLVFMSALGYYITPALIGGPGDQMISAVIAFYATGAANWGMAGALGIVLLGATLALYAVYQRLATDRTVGA